MGWAVEAAVATAASKLNVEHLQDRRVADLAAASGSASRSPARC